MKKENLYPILIITVVAILLYIPILDNFFISDDLWQLDLAKTISKEPSKLFFSGDVSNTHFRPVSYMIVLFVYSISQLNPLGYRILSLIFHVACSILVYYIALNLTKKRIMAFVAGLFFAAYSAPSDAVIWMSGNHTLFEAFFYFLAFYCFMQYLKTRRIVYYWISFISCIFSFLSKEASSTFIVVIYLYEWLIVERKMPFSFKQLRKYVPFIIITIIFVGFEFVYQQSNIQISQSYYKFGPHIAKNILTYLTSMILGLPQINFITKSDAVFLVYFGGFAFILPLLKGLVYLIMFLAPALLVALLINGSNQKRFLVLWVIVTLIPSSLFTYGTTSRYSYLASLGYVILITSLLFYIPKILKAKMGTRILYSIIAIICVFFIMLSNVNERIFDNQGEQSKKIITDLKELHPDLETNSRLYFVNTPNLLVAGVGKSHLTELVQLFYDDGTLMAYSITNEEVSSIQLDDNQFIFEYKDGLVEVGSVQNPGVGELR